MVSSQLIFDTKGLLIIKVKPTNMKEFVNDVQSLIVKHWGKLIIVGLLVTLLFNYDDVIRGARDGWNAGYSQTK